MFEEQKTWISNNSSKALNLIIRFTLNFVVGLTFPTYCFLIYFAHYGFFPYDIFDSGHFALNIFFYTTILFILGLATLIAAPVYLFFDPFNTGKKETWRRYVLTAFALIPCVLVLILLGQKETYLLISSLFIITIFSILTISAFLAKRSINYLIGSLVFIFLLYMMPLYFHLITTNTVGFGLQSFRVGGGNDFSYNEMSTNVKIEGKLVLLTPEYIIYRTDASDVTKITSRSHIQTISVNEKMRTKQ